MESAIPQTLRCPRTQALRMEEGYTPPYPAWTARPASGAGEVVMGYFGVQWLDEAQRAPAYSAVRHIVSMFDGAEGPVHYDLAYYEDEAGYSNAIAIAYWNDPALYRRWEMSPMVEPWWGHIARHSEGLGYFREILVPSSEGFETLFSASDQLEGAGVALGVYSQEEIQEHGYWGSMRDRLPLSQSDPLTPDGGLEVSRDVRGDVARVSGHTNIAVIRSGQDWRATSGSERDLYLTEMEPVLRSGMEFLRDYGREVGCYSNRYMRHIDIDGALLEKSFGHSYWRSLHDMEQWSQYHPTHLAIFNKFLSIVQSLAVPPLLRLYHEVVVLRPHQQFYEYICCHSETGMMKGLLPLT